VQLVGDLRLALTRAGALTGIADDDLEDTGKRNALQLGDLGRDGGAVADGGSEGGGLTIDQLQGQSVDRRTDSRQIAEFAVPELGPLERSPG
jgi:hypothetical protein